jgi:excisionase family DNA binding protein
VSPVLAQLLSTYGPMTGTKGACTILGLERGTVTRMANEGVLRHRRAGRKYLFSVELLHDWLMGSDGPSEPVQALPTRDPDAEHARRLAAARAAVRSKRAGEALRFTGRPPR